MSGPTRPTREARQALLPAAAPFLLIRQLFDVIFRRLDGLDTTGASLKGFIADALTFAFPSIFTVSVNTTTDTVTVTLAAETANTAFLGPDTGAAAAPTFRAIVNNDLPTVAIAHGGTGQVTKAAAFDALSPLSAVGDVLYGGTAGTGTRLAPNTLASIKFLSQTGTGAAGQAPTWATAVTSVGLALPAIFTVSGSPVTTSGTLTGTLATQAANIVWAGPTSGAAAAPTFRAIVAADLPTIAIAGGGTGQTTASAAFNALSPLTTLGDTLYGSGTNTNARLAGNITTTKKYFSQTGDGAASAIPAWAQIAAGDLAAGGTFPAISATNLTAVPAANVTGAAALPDSVLSANVPLINAANTFTGANKFNDAGNNPVSLFRDVNAGDSTNLVQLQVGNSGASQGTIVFRYTNAAAAGSPVATIGFLPRKNDDTTSINPGNITFTKDAAANTAAIKMVASSAFVYVQGSSGFVGINNLSPAVALDVTGAFAASTSAAIGGGTAITKRVKATATLSPAAVAANTTAEQTFTLTGATAADTGAVNKPTAQAGLGIVGVRYATDQVMITFSNNTGLSITPTASEVYRFIYDRS